MGIYSLLVNTLLIMMIFLGWDTRMDSEELQAHTSIWKHIHTYSQYRMLSYPCLTNFIVLHVHHHITLTPVNRWTNLGVEAAKPVDMSPWPSYLHCGGGRCNGRWVRQEGIIDGYSVNHEGVLDISWFETIQLYHLSLSIHINSESILVPLYELIWSIIGWL